MPVNNNSYFYPAASLSYVFTDLLNASWLNFAKVRGAIAQVGSDTDPYNTLLTYELRQPFGTSSRVTVPNTLPNPELKPEISTEYEVGLELRGLNDRIGINASYYDRKTRDQILPLSRTAATGFAYKYVNAGLVENKGVELSLTGSPVRSDNFSWDIIVNWAKNKNKVVELTADQKIYIIANAPFAVQLQAREGESFGSIYGYNYKFDSQGRRLVDEEGFYLRSDEQEVIGSVLPDYTGGITNTFKYKGIVLNALLEFQKGGDFFSTTQMFGNSSGILKETAEGDVRETGVVAPGYTEAGTPNTAVVDAQDHFFQNGGYVINAADIVDASYLYLREVSLGYNLPTSFIGKTPFSNIRVAAVGRNLWLISSNSKHVDPSNITNSITNVQGLEGGALPSVRSYGLTLTLGL